MGIVSAAQLDASDRISLSDLDPQGVLRAIEHCFWEFFSNARALGFPDYIHPVAPRDQLYFLDECDGGRDCVIEVLGRRYHCGGIVHSLVPDVFEPLPPKVEVKSGDCQAQYGGYEPDPLVPNASQACPA